MEPRGLQEETMNWNMTPELYKKTPGLPTLIMNPKVWHRWCEPSCMQWEPNNLPRNFRWGMTLAICQNAYNDHPDAKLWDQIVVSIAAVYVLEHWHLVTFSETSYMINKAKEGKDTGGIMSLTQLHKKAQFYPDISFLKYKQHMTGLHFCSLP